MIDLRLPRNVFRKKHCVYMEKKTTLSLRTKADAAFGVPLNYEYRLSPVWLDHTILNLTLVSHCKIFDTSSD